MDIPSFGFSPYSNVYGVDFGSRDQKDLKNPQKSEDPQKTQDSSDEKEESSVSSEPKEKDDLSAGEKALVSKLQAVDAAIRAHEAAHLAAGGGVVRGGASFSYTTGPDGKSYATAGEVPIDMSGGNTPEETISKMQQVRAAALAPSDPSPQDYKVASSATILEMKARAELQREQRDELMSEEQIKTYQENALA